MATRASIARVTRSCASLAAAAWLGACAASAPHVSSTPVAQNAAGSPSPPATLETAPPTRFTDDERPAPPPRPPPRPLQVLELRNDNSALVSFRVVFEAGSADDPPGREGLTRLLARLMAEGGTEALTYEALTRQLFPMAARIEFHVDRDMVVFTGQVHRDHLAAFYPLFRDVIVHPRLADEDFRRVRTQTVNDLTVDLRSNNDEELGKEALQSLIYHDHPYGHPELGTASGLERITAADVRAHREQVFCRDRIFVGVAGGYPAALPAQLRADLEGLPALCPVRAELPVPSRPTRVRVLVIDKPAASSTAISIGLPTTVTRADGEFPALQFATNYLGIHRQSSGVLYQSLREARGLNYGDYAYAEHFEQDSYTRFPLANVQRRQQYASLWIRPVRPSAAHFALRAAVRAMGALIERGVPDADLPRAQTFLSGFVGLYAQTETQRLGYMIDDLWNHAQHGGYVAQMREAWRGMDRAAVLAAAQHQLSTRELWVAIVAPNASELANAIGHNLPSPIQYDSPKPPEILAEDREIQGYALNVRPEDVRVVPAGELFQ